MYIYLLAINLFALTALSIALLDMTQHLTDRRLLPLFLLVICHSLALILTLAGSEEGPPASLIGALWVFSTGCVVWALLGASHHLPRLWQGLVGAGGVIALIFIGLSLIPGWPVPFHIHSLLIAIFGASLIFITTDQPRWLRPLIPISLAIASFVTLLGLDGTGWFISLLAYGGLVGALHWQTLPVQPRSGLAADLLADGPPEVSRERQHFLEVSELLSNAPNLRHSLEHIARTMAHMTHADQSAIFGLDSLYPKEARLLTLYSPQRPFHIHDPDAVTCLLADCPPLAAVISSQEQLVLPQPHLNGLERLYSLWDDTLTGPTLLQPLVAQGRPIGVLMLGNPISQAQLRPSDARLCQNVATQIAALVEHHRRYLQLEIEAESMARTAKKQTTVSDQTQSAILAVINDGVVVSNAAGYVQFVNRAAERILGKSGQALLGQSIGTIYGEIDSKEAIDELLVSFSRRDQPLPTFLEEDDRAIQGRLIPWRDDRNEWLGIIAVFRDVTREVKADRARNDFIAALSHELRAPLTMVKGYSELIANGAIDAYPSQQLQAQQIIHSSTERIAEVLDNAIKVSAQNRHQVLPRFEEIDATKIIEKVVHEIIPIARLNEQKFTSDIDRNLIPIMADAKHIYRILYNLLSNACRFTPPGGRINLRVWIQPDLASLTREPSFCMTVQDNGTGIPKEDFSRVFDRFYRSKSQPLDGGGMGLGLTVVKELVELHNGRVWVESTVGSGSAFHVALPVRQEY